MRRRQLSLLLLLTVASSPVVAAGPRELKAIDPGSWVTNQDYPDDAIRAGEQGITSFRLDVNQEGRVARCTVTNSSGSAILDAATCDILSARARFVPALDKRGRSIPSSYSARFRWILPDDDAVPDIAGIMITRLDFAADATLEGCSLEAQGDFSEVDSDAHCAEMTAQMGAAFLAKQGAAYKTVRFVNAISTGERNFPTDRSDWGVVVQRFSGEIHVDDKDRAIACVPLAAIGAGPPQGFCGTLPPGIKIVNDPAAKAVRKMIHDIAVFAVPRERDTPLLK